MVTFSQDEKYGKNTSVFKGKWPNKWLKNDAAEIYYKGILNEFYDSDYFDYTLINLSILESFNSIEGAKGFINKSKTEFQNEENYLYVVELLNSIEENKKMEYYTKLLK